MIETTGHGSADSDSEARPILVGRASQATLIQPTPRFAGSAVLALPDGGLPGLVVGPIGAGFFRLSPSVGSVPSLVQDSSEGSSRVEGFVHSCRSETTLAILEDSVADHLARSFDPKSGACHATSCAGRVRGSRSAWRRWPWCRSRPIAARCTRPSPAKRSSGPSAMESATSSSSSAPTARGPTSTATPAPARPAW